MRGGTWDVFYWVDDADALYHELRERGATTAYVPVDRPEYGMREFAMRDHLGYVLGFGHQLPSEGSPPERLARVRPTASHRPVP